MDKNDSKETIFFQGSWKSITGSKIILSCTTVSNVDNKSGTCDTGDWNNDAGNPALVTGINYSLKYIKVENHYFQL